MSLQGTNDCQASSEVIIWQVDNITHNNIQFESNHQEMLDKPEMNSVILKREKRNILSYKTAGGYRNVPD